VKAPCFLFVRRRRLAPQLASRERAQGMAEFALALPIFIVMMMVTLQIAMLVTAQLGVIWTANAMARYMAGGGSSVTDPQHWTQRDSCHTTFKNNTVAAFRMLSTANLTTTITPAWEPGTGSCAAPSAFPTPAPRVRGGPIQVTMQYTPSNIRFLPATFFGVPVMQTLPPYTATAVLE
jgi:Flp pilus assembly protein TadG